MAYQATTKDAYLLLHRGSLALARAEANGIRIDTAYLREVYRETSRGIRRAESAMLADPVWRDWQKLFGTKAKLGSREQLAELFFSHYRYPCRHRTEKGDKPSTEANNFIGLGSDHQAFVQRYFRWQKLSKARSTYLKGIHKEVCGGFLHPGFNLHTVQSYRGSSSGPNFQNIPVRDPEVGKMIRRAFVPRRGRRIIEVDLAGAEVRVAYCYHLDPTMRDYLLNPASDMHGDTAEELFLLDKGWVKQNAAWAKRKVRDWSKNRFVFPAFYGSVYFQMAPHLWEAIEERNAQGQYTHVMPDGTPLIEHLAKKGVSARGRCDPKQRPEPGTFEHLVQRVEKSFWEKRFPVYTAWKERWFRNYQGFGYFDLYTGFRCWGVYRRNQVINYPVQGAAFHVLLWSLIRLQDWLDKHRMGCLIVGQIHDSIILDCPDDEVQDVLTALRHIITVACPRAWSWLTIPLEVEAEVCEPDTSWDTKKAWTQGEGGAWAPKAA